MASQTTITLRDAMVERIPPTPLGVRPDREVIANVAAFIAERFTPQRIVLFGSRAYGTPTGDSDVDLLVIMDSPGRPVDQAIRIRQALDLRPPFALDVLVRTPAQIALGLEEGDFFIEDIMTQGVTLFEAGDAGLVGQG
jgi:predicted nucleotidyltransferase